MGFRIDFNPQQLEANVRQIGERAVKGMHLVAKRRAIAIRDLARAYAPVKTGALESAIDYMAMKDGRRNSYVVFIDIDQVRRNGKGAIGEYAWLMEEGLSPYGSGRYQLGVGSLLKKAMTGQKVGGRFLRRAVNDGSKLFMDEMVVAVRRVTGDSRVTNMSFERDIGDDE